MCGISLSSKQTNYVKQGRPLFRGKLLIAAGAFYFECVLARLTQKSWVFVAPLAFSV